MEARVSVPCSGQPDTCPCHLSNIVNDFHSISLGLITTLPSMATSSESFLSSGTSHLPHTAHVPRPYIILDLIAFVMFCDDCKPWSVSLCALLKPTVTYCTTGGAFSNYLILCSPVRAKHRFTFIQNNRHKRFWLYKEKTIIVSLHREVRRGFVNTVCLGLTMSYIKIVFRSKTRSLANFLQTIVSLPDILEKNVKVCP